MNNSEQTHSPAESPIALLAPFRLDPMFVERIWGYLDLRPHYDHVTESTPIGEVWLTGDDCLIATGTYKGLTLGELFKEQPRALLGDSVSTSELADGSPLLVKLLFAKEKLSVQVHPDDVMAQKYGMPRGKTECWYALSAEPGAQVALGLKPGTTDDDIKTAIDQGNLEDHLNLVSVAAGDMIFVDAGTVHAVWPGSVLLETQQYSDTTYRLYDYGRPRPLQVDLSLEAIVTETHAGKVLPRPLTDRTVVIDEKYFVIERLTVKGQRSAKQMARPEAELSSEPKFEPELGPEFGPGFDAPARTLSYLYAIHGQAKITSAENTFEPVVFSAGQIVAIPANTPDWQIESQAGIDLIRIRPNSQAA